MKQYIGTKMVMATPMSRFEYNEYRGWRVPDNENGDDTGFLVEYVNDGARNDARHAGYISWSPTNIFEKTHQPMDAMNFGHALEILKAGGRVARRDWKGKDMFLFSVPASHNLIVNREPLLSILGKGAKFNYQQHIDMFTADGTIVPWTCSQSDILAEDWYSDMLAEEWYIFPNA